MPLSKKCFGPQLLMKTGDFSQVVDLSLTRVDSEHRSLLQSEFYLSYLKFFFSFFLLK